MRRAIGLPSIQVWAALCSFTLTVLPCASSAQIPSQAQDRPDTRSDKDFQHTGQLSLLLQDTTGEAFFAGATVTLYPRDMNAAQTLRTVADVNGRARFTMLPAGPYVLEIAAPGYRTIQQAIMINGTNQTPNLTFSLVPVAVSGKVKLGAASVAPKAIKETDKALRALEANRINEAQQHLALALAIDPNFADGNYLMGVVLLRQKDSARARAYLQRSVEFSPDHAAGFLALGEAEYLEHDYARATESLQKFLQSEPHSPQAPVARKYVEAMQKALPSGASGDAGSAPGASEGATPGESQTTDAAKQAALPDLPAPGKLDPTTESSWAPPDVDDEKLDLDSNGACQLDEVVRSAGRRMQELVANVNRFTATENLEHFKLSPLGLETSRESRKFKYVAEIHPMGGSDLEVEEYRRDANGKEDFPDGIATIGLSSLALIFHPNLSARYEFRCDGRGAWEGHQAWVVHFQQKHEESSGMLTYIVAGRSVAVGLRGRAWIDANNMQVLAMESDIMNPLPEIRLKRDHQVIEYGPVSFRKDSMQLWLPKSADWYCSISGRRFHRRHSFSQFLLFSVDDRQSISAPKVDESQ